MPEYLYRMRNPSGRVTEGRLFAASEREAAKSIVETGSLVLDLRPARRKLFPLARVDRRFSMILCRQLAMMLSSGLTIGEALRFLSERKEGSEEERIVSELYRTVSSGGTLAEAMRRRPQVFGRKVRALVDAGEKSGSLDVMLTRLSDSMESEYAAREKLLTLMMYPFVILVALLAVAAFMFTFILPTFAAMFRTLSTELPLPTRVMLNAHDFLASYGLWFIVAAVAAAFLAVRLYRREAYRVEFDRFLLGLPVFGKLFLLSELMDIAGTLSVLLSGGIVLDRALSIAGNVTGNASLQRKLQKAHSEVQKGNPISDAFRRYGLFPPLFLELLAAGEAAGELPAMLDKIAAFCRLDMDTQAERVRALLPPLALLLLGGAAGLMIFSIVLPLLDSMTAFM